MKLRVAIVDDEAAARQRLTDLLAREDDVELVGDYSDAAEAARTLSRHNCDLLFLDIEMPGMSGIDVARAVGASEMPMVVFVTAYDAYALQAFDLHALDYLLKPYDDERFAAALARARERHRLHQIEDFNRRLAALLDSYAKPLPPDVPPSRHLRRIAVKDGERTVLVPVERVDYIHADGPYAELHVGERTLVLRERMHALEEQLDPREFVRIHRSTIVRLDRIVALEPAFRGELVARLRDGTTLAVSRGQRAELERRLFHP